MCPYCGHFQPHKQFRPMNQTGNCVIRLAIANHENCCFMGPIVGSSNSTNNFDQWNELGAMSSS